MGKRPIYKKVRQTLHETVSDSGKSILSYRGNDDKIYYVASSDDPDVEPGGGGSGIESIEQTVTSEESGGVNVITVTTSDGATTDFQVRNGAQGEGFVSVEDKTPNPDGTAIITLTNGDTITLDLNHVHPQYLKYELVSSLPASPDSGTLYLIAAT